MSAKGLWQSRWAPPGCPLHPPDGPHSEKCALTLSLWFVSSKSFFSTSFLTLIGNFLNLPAPLLRANQRQQWYLSPCGGGKVNDSLRLPEQCLARGTRSLLAQWLLPAHPLVCCPKTSVKNKFAKRNVISWTGS